MTTGNHAKAWMARWVAAASARSTRGLILSHRSERDREFGWITFALSAFIFFVVSSVALGAYAANPAPTLLVTDFCTHAVTYFSHLAISKAHPALSF
jgi:hypothetical protein